MDEYDFEYDHERFEDDLYEHECNEVALDNEGEPEEESDEDEHPDCFHCGDSGIECDYCGTYVEMSQD